MTWQEAVMQVLSEADQPLDYNEVTRQIGERGYRELTGATPVNTVNRVLGELIAEGRAVRTGPGLYAVPSIAERAETALAAEEIAAEEAASDPERLTVKAYGLYWDRRLVDWSPARGQLWGQQDENAIPVNFADQAGIYLLHSWNEIVYVCQTFRGEDHAGLFGRLKHHHPDRDKRKSDRWDTFSWFGFKPVDDYGRLLRYPENGTLGSVIDVLEAVFIEALMPRLNMQTGRGSRQLRETGLYFQSSFQRASRGFR
jgi:hypothetical protein